MPIFPRLETAAIWAECDTECRVRTVGDRFGAAYAGIIEGGLSGCSDGGVG